MLPTIPTIPSVPAIPGVPAVPAIPSADGLKSKLPKLPQHPEAIFKLEVDGQDFTKKIAKRLSSLTLIDCRGINSDSLEIVLEDHDGKLPLPNRGGVISLSLGWKGTGLIDKGTYTIDQIDYEGTPDIITIHARAVELDSGLTTKRERSFHNTTVGDIVATIAAENEMKYVVSKRFSAMPVAHIDQTNESSIAFLTRMTGMFDAIATVKKDNLMFVCAATGTSASGIALPRITITRKDGDRHHFSIADRDNYTHVKALYDDTGLRIQGEVIWDKQTDADETGRKLAVKTFTGNYMELTHVYKSRKAAMRDCKKRWGEISKSKAQLAKYVGVKANYNDLNLKVSAVVSYGAEDEQQIEQNAAKLAKRDTAKNAAPQVAFEPSADNIKILSYKFANQNTARDAARAEWRKLQRNMATFSIDLALGRPELLPETPVTVQGWKKQIDSTDWLITKATHTLTDKGLTTKLEFEIKATELAG